MIHTVGRGLTLLLLSGCTWANAQPGACTEITPTATVTALGEFSNMRFTEEQAYGYSVKLWRAGHCLFGLFESAAGLAGDTPVGELHDVKYDSGTATLSFSAKLTMGAVSFRGSNGFEQSRDLYSFAGRLTAATMAGVVTHALQNDPNSKPTRDTAVLRASTTPNEFMRMSSTYAEWRDQWQPILRFRGPKW